MHYAKYFTLRVFADQVTYTLIQQSNMFIHQFHLCGLAPLHTLHCTTNMNYMICIVVFIHVYALCRYKATDMLLFNKEFF